MLEKRADQDPRRSEEIRRDDARRTGAAIVLGIVVLPVRDAELVGIVGAGSDGR